MTDERLTRAIRRLDGALARVEAASMRAATRPSADHQKLMLRHERLRTRAQEAIAAIDRLTGAR